MQRHQRLNAVIDLVARSGSISVDDIATEFGVSIATARRDLDMLADQQLLSRTRGGAVAQSLSYDLPVRYRTTQQSSAMQRIALAAADLVEDNAIVGMNGGTMTTAVARALCAPPTGPEGSTPFTLVTNALNIAAELTIWPQVKIVVPGGVARPRPYDLVGPFAHRTLDGLTLDVLFLGVDAMSAEAGVFAAHEGEAQLDATLVERADRVVVVTESDRIGGRAFCRVCDIEQLDLVITDGDLRPRDRTALEAAGVEVRTV